MGNRLSSELDMMKKAISVLLITIITSNTVIPIAKAGECVRVARDCIEPGETRVINGHSIYRDCWRYNDAYKCKNYARNDCYEFDDENYCQLEKSECKEKVGNWCVAQKREYKCEEEEKYMKKEKRFKAPSIKRDNISERKRVECGEAVKCIDGRCFDSSYESNNEMGEAVGALSTLKEMQDEGIECAKCPENQPDCVPDPKSCKVFKGEVNKCVVVRGQWITYAVAAASIYFAVAGVAAPSVFSQAGAGSVWGGMPTASKLKFIAAQAAKVGLASLAKVDCCNMKGLLAPACGGKSAGLMAKKQQRFCIHVGEYRHRKLKGLVITNTYCCFKSRIAKEIQEQTRKGNKNTNMQPMLNRSFGDARNPDCKGLNFEEMQKVNWEKIDFDFLGEEIEKSSLWKKMGDMTKAMEHTENLMKDEINAIKSDFADNTKTNNKTDEVEIDDIKLFQEKMDEKHDNPAKQKKPDGRDKSRDIKDEKDLEYKQDIYKNRDRKGL